MADIIPFTQGATSAQASRDREFIARWSELPDTDRWVLFRAMQVVSIARHIQEHAAPAQVDERGRSILRRARRRSRAALLLAAIDRASQGRLESATAGG